MGSASSVIASREQNLRFCLGRLGEDRGPSNATNRQFETERFGPRPTNRQHNPKNVRGEKLSAPRLVGWCGGEEFKSASILMAGLFGDPRKSGFHSVLGSPGIDITAGRSSIGMEDGGSAFQQCDTKRNPIEGVGNTRTPRRRPPQPPAKVDLNMAQSYLQREMTGADLT